ncbi:MAG: putative glycoside hydrolase, partial [Chloroflexi bacterium]|nr:putative glycoside hydrolase [Chloroflexota bacterium]
MTNRILSPLIFSLPLLILAALLVPYPTRANEPSASFSVHTNLISSTHVLSPTALADEAVPPTYIKGLYMTYSAVGHEGLRTNALNLIDTTELNALVIDIKGDKGLLTYKSDVITATAIGANNAPTIRDWRVFMQGLKERNIYTIARIVVFKDNFMGRAHPEWAVKTASGELWFDREELPWLEAFHEEVWDYNVALAVEAAQRGFDEIQFDYVRFPTDGRLSNIVYSRPIDDPEVRKAAINGFLAKAHQALEPFDTKLAVDVFGYTTWHKGDFRIGQDVAAMAAYLDVISPMTYPSTYDHGLPGMPEYDDNTVAYPYEVVYESLIRGLSRVKATNPDLIMRPWIQDFPDYGFDRRTYTPDEIREQMFAAYDAGGGGWMLWDPRVRYTS